MKKLTFMKAGFAILVLTVIGAGYLFRSPDSLQEMARGRPELGRPPERPEAAPTPLQQSPDAEPQDLSKLPNRDPLERRPAVPLWTVIPERSAAARAAQAPPSHPQHRERNGEGRRVILDPNSLASLAQLRRGDAVILPLLDGTPVTGEVNLVQPDVDGWTRVAGNLTGAERGTFSVSRGDGKLSVQILLPQREAALQVAEEGDGRLVMRQRLLSEVMCLGLPRPNNEPAKAAGPVTSVAPPVLSSRPTVTAVLYLDFDGETVTDPQWNGGNTITAAPSTLSAAEMTSVWRRVKEDFWPFNIDVTTNEARYSGAPVGQRMRCIITPTNSWRPGVGGVAYLHSFDRAGTTLSSTVPCWVFNPGVIGIAEAVSHELGHTLGLDHDGRISPSEVYYEGHGSGATGWAPIMGASYYQQLTQWSKGEYASANNPEDDVAIIANSTNGFGYVADDASDTFANATPLNLVGGNIDQPGTIHAASDVDFYVFSTGAGQLNIEARAAPESPNLDSVLELQDSSGNLLVRSNPVAGLNASLSLTIPAGTYYLKVLGTGEGAVLQTGYSNYGSIGEYTLIGTMALLPVISNLSATSPILSTITLNAEVNANGSATAARFEYGLTSSYGSIAAITLSPNNGASAVAVNSTVTGLAQASLYHYRVVATNSGGTVNSNDATFITSGSPVFNSAAHVPFALAGFTATGLTLTPVLNFAPQAGTTLTLVNNTGTSAIAGRLTNIANGGTVALTHNGISYTFRATYYGGTGNDLVLALERPGVLDAAFGTDGIVTTGIGSGDEDGSAVAVQSDGKIVVAGVSYNGSSNDFAVVRYTATGVLDASFGTGGKVTTSLSPANDSGYGVGIQSDGKIVVAGTVYNGTARDFALVRYTATGALDTSFGTGGTVLTDFGSYDEGRSLVIQSDGKIVVVGTGASTADFALVRYNTNGSLDSSFGSGGKVITDIGGSYIIDIIQSVTLQSDGKLVVAGRAWNGSQYDTALARYTTTGALDTSFGTGGKVITPIGPSHDGGNSVAVQSDGKIVVGGYSGTNPNYDFTLVRYTSAGALDASFGSGGIVTTAVSSGEDQAQGVVLQSDGKIVVVGSSDNGTNADIAVVRYNTNGTLDTSFHGTGIVTTPIGPGNDRARAVALQADGHIVVAGVSFNGTNNDFAVVRYLGDPLPVVTLAGVTGLTPTTATLNGTVNPNGLATTAEFQYGLTTGYGSTASLALVPNNGSNAQVVSTNLTGLTPGTLYHYRLTATNANGTSNTTGGTFTTALSPQQIWRQTYFGITTNTGDAADTADPDGDGSNNHFEFVAGLVPNDPASRFSVRVEPVAGQPTKKAIIFRPLVPGRTYIVKRKASLTDPTWTPLTDIATSDNGTERTVTDLGAGTGAKFYTVEIALP